LGYPIAARVDLFSRCEGERKQVTVLFADLKGSMELPAKTTEPGQREGQR